MQLGSEQNAGGAWAPTRKVITTILSLCSLAGLVIGFAVGGLTHPQASKPTNTNLTSRPTIVAQTTPTSSTSKATATPVVLLGEPQLTTYSSNESHTASTSYTATMKAVDKKNKAVHSPDVTCKLWLVPSIPAHQSMNIDPKILANVSDLASPIPATLNGQPLNELQYLSFSSSTPQLTKCDSNGQATWNYTLLPTAVPGNYELVVLADWKGIHYNWYWNDITIS